MLTKNQIKNFVKCMNSNSEYKSLYVSHMQRFNLISFTLNNSKKIIFDNKMNLVAKVHYDVDFNDFEDADNVYKFEIYPSTDVVLVVIDISYDEYLYEEIVLLNEDPKEYMLIELDRLSEYYDSLDQNN